MKHIKKLFKNAFNATINTLEVIIILIMTIIILVFDRKNHEYYK